MLFPYWPEFRHRQTDPYSVPWNDPYRPFYPHHAQLWPAKVPEHVMFQRKAQALARKRRKAVLGRFLCLDRLGQFFGRKPAQEKAAAPDGKAGEAEDRCPPEAGNFRFSQADCACRPAC